MTHILAAVGAVACFLLAGRLTWAMLRRPARQWECRWVDGNDPKRRRKCSGARSVPAGQPVVYRHHDADGDVVYVGQTINFPNRMYQEGKERMSAYFHHTIAVACRKADLDDVEREQIAAYRPHLNRTRGNAR